MFSAIITVTGVGPYRKQHQEAEPGHASHLQQTSQPFLLTLGAGHRLQEEDQGTSFYQPGFHSDTSTLQFLELLVIVWRHSQKEVMYWDFFVCRQDMSKSNKQNENKWFNLIQELWNWISVMISELLNSIFIYILFNMQCKWWFRGWLNVHHC